MSNYKHGIRTSHQATALSVPITSDGCLQCVIGTAPVNMAEDPYNTVGKPFVVYNKPAAISAVGYSTDFEKYTLCQSIYATFDVFAVAPLILINVLDPTKHVKAELSKEYNVVGGKVTIDETGILLDQLSIASKDGGTTYVADTDYVTSFNSDGTVSVAISKTGTAKAATEIKATFVQIDPDAVTYEDVIGSYNLQTRIRTGMELIGQVYPKYGVVPSLLLAPGWSHIPAVNLALNAKAKLISSLFTAKAVSDLDTSEGKAEGMEDVKEYKDGNAYSDRDTIPLWPMVGVGDYKYYYSAQMAAHMQYLAASNSGVPSKSPSNKDIKITGLYTKAGEEVFMEMDEANDFCNACGVVTAINMNGWKCWGNNTAAYPSTSDPIDRWINIVTIFDYIENNFKLTFFQNVDDLTNYRLIDEVVSGFNIQLNGLQGSDDIAGGEISFDHDENPINNILAGHIKFHTRIGGYTPAEDIENVFEFDPTITQAALEGGAE
ncbi:phage tail sheath family protein [Anaerocolumna xylanovorans]|uniref:Phage tail sheath family protein n=1 Tax=Anaerocolumna xylanovorans DSM 12503 TaxID=1121345 RepID=A0A1M7YBQ4_9FIRM|nr:hypothetical protein [Anaerocolumna xylanovorans]SHO50070.1 hypothetical protein SAMN02745217_02570 [Anaerocolumna xylanovorans DSM 12503]